jgi:hypothetical protein
MSRKIRNSAPESPAPAEENVEQAKRGRGRPKGSRESNTTRVLRPEVAGVRQESFPNVPVELWNRLTAVTADFLNAVARKLESAYATDIETELAELLDATLPDAALALGRATIEVVAAQERGFHGSTLPCHICSECLEYQGDVDKTVKTRIGDATLKRAYYHGPCGHSVSPLDMLLGVDGRHAVMPSLQDAVAWMTASMSYPETVKFLEQFCPSKFSLKAVETITATVARQVQEDQHKEIQAMLEDPSTAARRNGPLLPGVAVVEADGGFVLVRDHTEPSREFKLGVLGHLAETVCPTKDAEPGEVDKGVKLVEKSFVGHFAGPDMVFNHIQTEYFRRGFHKLQTLHGISDGGPWIMPRIELLAQEGQEVSLILDWWHADERVAQAANSLYGSGTDAAKSWRTDTRSDLWYDRLEAFFLKLQQAIDDAKTPEDREKLQEHHDYFAARRHLLRYQECRDRGLPIGSGAIEGGIRFIGKDRLDRTGMRWKVAGAEAILQLRCVKYSERWAELAEKRAGKRRQVYQAARRRWLQAA